MKKYGSVAKLLISPSAISIEEGLLVRRYLDYSVSYIWYNYIYFQCIL